MRDTIELAREVGMKFSPAQFSGVLEAEIDEFSLKDFEALVRADERNRTWTQEHWTEYERSIAAAEREACAKVCDALQDCGPENGCCPTYWNEALEKAESTIRARGNT
jgi:hypothetical protein